MNSVFDKLNLRPQERRLVVIVGIVVFVVLNFVFVFPNFGAFGRIQQRTIDARQKLDLYNREINKQSTYRKEIDTLRTQGVNVATEAKVLTLAQDVNNQAGISGVNVPVMTPMQRGSTTGKTNAFFEEQSVVVSVNTGEKELVDFLYRLADKELLIRARSMDISPDVSRMKLQGRITLVKSFQRNPPPRAGLATPVPPAKTSAPAANTNAPEETRKLPAAAPASSTSPPTTAPGRTLGGSPPPKALGGTNRLRRLPPTPVK